MLVCGGVSVTPGAGAGRVALPAGRIERILGVSGSVSSGVLDVSVDRTDIGTVRLRGVPVKPPFEVSGDLTFQPLSPGRALFNGDIALRPREVDPVIAAILAKGLLFQAEHQHFYDLDPMVWFIHFRGVGEPVRLARAVRGVLAATSTPLPQTAPANPATPLDAPRLKAILHGQDVRIDDDGVVTVSVARRDAIRLGGVRAEPEANISTTVAFEPLDRAGTRAAVAPDFALEAAEVDPVMQVMRGAGWDIGCLYNQETAEHPQLYFSHQFKTGDPYVLAQEVRQGLDRMNTA
jgi:hypothetical protein